MSATRAGPSSWSTLPACAPAMASARVWADASIASTAATGSSPSSSRGERSQATASSSGSVVASGALMPPGYAERSAGQRPGRRGGAQPVEHDREVAPPRLLAAVLLLGRAADAAHQHRHVVEHRVVAQNAGLLGAGDQPPHRLLEAHDGRHRGLHPPGDAREDLAEGPVGGHDLGATPEHGAERLPRVLDLQRRLGVCGDRLEGSYHQRLDQRLLGGEVAVHRPDPDPRPPRHIVHLGVATVLGEDRASGGEDLLAIAPGVGAQRPLVRSGDVCHALNVGLDNRNVNSVWCQPKAELLFRYRPKALKPGPKGRRRGGRSELPMCGRAARASLGSSQTISPGDTLSPIAADRKWLALALLALAQFVVVLD